MQGFSLTAAFLVISFLFAVYAEHDVTSFSSEIIDDERVWLVEFYSTMCGSCKEFSTVWSQVESSMRSIVTAQVNIDFPEGMEIAKKLKVLEEGVPNVKLLNRKHVEGGTTIMSGKGGRNVLVYGHEDILISVLELQCRIPNYCAS
jgi:thiol-disulfide isomerase/thioredoxin